MPNMSRKSSCAFMLCKFFTNIRKKGTSICNLRYPSYRYDIHQENQLTSLRCVSLQVQTCFSDHRLVLFSSHFPDPVVATPSVTRLNRYFSTQSCERFAASYAITDPPVPELSSPVQDVNRLFNFFNQKCLSTLNLIAPLKPKRIVTNSQQWLNDSSLCLWFPRASKNPSLCPYQRKIKSHA